MICLRCGHYAQPDREMARVQGSDDCPCMCHRPDPWADRADELRRARLETPADPWGGTCELRPGTGGRMAIVCRLCGSTSELPGDVEHRYCGRCHLFHDAIAGARTLHRDGATHECGEWRTARGTCAVCGRVLETPDPDPWASRDDEIRRAVLRRLETPDDDRETP